MGYFMASEALAQCGCRRGPLKASDSETTSGESSGAPGGPEAALARGPRRRGG